MALVPFAAPKYEVDALVPGTPIPGGGTPETIFAVRHLPVPATLSALPGTTTVTVEYQAESGGPWLPWTFGGIEYNPEGGGFLPPQDSNPFDQAYSAGQNGMVFDTQVRVTPGNGTPVTGAVVQVTMPA